MSVIDTEKALQELVARGIHIPPQPEILAELQDRLGDGNYDAASLAAIVQRDPGIAARLFKVARSPVFHTGLAPDSLEQVLVRLGLKQTINLVRAVALGAALPAAGQALMQGFWVRSREVALFAALIAEARASVCNIFADQAYMAGIFHGCGVPVLLQRFPDYGATLDGDGMDFPCLQEEDRRFQVDHASIGYLVARHWRLPDFVAQAVLHYGEMPREELGPVRSMVAILQLAIHCHRSLRHRPGSEWQRWEPDVLAELGLHPDALGEFMADLREAFDASEI